jgi:hypothetical protein
MKLCSWAKDGGPESTSWGFWLIECKPLFSIVLLKFDGRSREAYHTHAFNSLSWLLKGELHEEFIDGKGHPLFPSLKPIITRRETFHKVDSVGTSWAISFRGPWADRWREFLPNEGRFRTLANHRVEVA